MVVHPRTYPPWAEVTKLQLYKMYGRSKEAKAFVADLTKGCTASTDYHMLIYNDWCSNDSR